MASRLDLRVNTLYRNPEVKRITVKYLIILIIGVISITLGTVTILKGVNNLVLKQNAIVISKAISGEKPEDMIKALYKLPKEESIKQAEELMSQYGYNNNLTIYSNETTAYVLKQMLVIVVPIYILFITILYMFFLRELKIIYKIVEGITEHVDGMHKGKYNKIKQSYGEGSLAILISGINYMGERVNNSIETLKAEREYMKDFISDISHQLKTPLAALIMFNDIMKENEHMPSEDRNNFLNKFEEQLSRMDWLIMNLLKVGRLEAGAINFEKEKQPIIETIELSVSSLTSEAKKKDQTISILGDTNIEINHDSHWLAEALSNIIKNAIEHTGTGGQITIKVEGGKLISKISIEDNGQGMSEEMQKKIFKRFYKGESSTNPKSIGIGLSLAKSIIEKQGGEIKVKSKEGKGTTFIISFMEEI